MQGSALSVEPEEAPGHDIHSMLLRAFGHAAGKSISGERHSALAPSSQAQQWCTHAQMCTGWLNELLPCRACAC